jgi:hypothetical protein
MGEPEPAVLDILREAFVSTTTAGSTGGSSSSSRRSGISSVTDASSLPWDGDMDSGCSCPRLQWLCLSEWHSIAMNEALLLAPQPEPAAAAAAAAAAAEEEHDEDEKGGGGGGASGSSSQAVGVWLETACAVGSAVEGSYMKHTGAIGHREYSRNIERR